MGGTRRVRRDGGPFLGVRYELAVSEPDCVCVKRLDPANDLYPAVLDGIDHHSVHDGRRLAEPAHLAHDSLLRNRQAVWSQVTEVHPAAEAPDALICATGFRRALESLVGHLGVLDECGLPRSRGAEPAAPGLRFIGYVPRPGGLGYMAKEARRAAKAIARELSR